MREIPSKEVNEVSGGFTDPDGIDRSIIRETPPPVPGEPGEPQPNIDR